jgi:hypothetical protein
MHDFKIFNSGPSSTPLQLAELNSNPRLDLALGENFIMYLFQPRAEIIHELLEHVMEAVFCFHFRECIAFQPWG